MTCRNFGKGLEVDFQEAGTVSEDIRTAVAFKLTAQDYPHLSLVSSYILYPMFICCCVSLINEIQYNQ